MEQIKAMTDAFLNSTNRVKELSSDIIALMDRGIAPSGSQISAVMVEIEQIQNAYATIRELAKRSAPNDIALEREYSIYEYTELIETSRRAERQKQLEQYRQCIRNFLHVRSDDLSYEKELLPYRDEAAELLQRFQGKDDSGGFDAADIQRVEGFQLFTQAVELDDPGSDAATELMDRLENHFSGKTQRGLALKKYKISEIEAEAKKEDAVSLAAPPASVRPVAVAPDDTAIAKASAEAPVMVQARGKIKQSKANASSFKREITRMPKEIWTILPLLTNLGVLSAPQIFEFGLLTDCFHVGDGAQDTVKDAITRSLTQLIVKGIVVAYDLPEDQETVYCLTQYGSGCLEKSSICVDMHGFWSISFGQYRFCGENEIDARLLTDAYGHSAALLTYLARVKPLCDPDMFRNIKSSIIWKRDHFEVAVPDENRVLHSCGVCRCPEDLERLDGMDTLLIFPDFRQIVPKSDSDYSSFALSRQLLCWKGSGWEEYTIHAEAPEEDAPEAAEDSPEEENPSVEEAPPVPVEIKEKAASDALPSMEPCPQEAPAASDAQEDDGTVRQRCLTMIDAKQSPDDKSFLSLIYQLIREDTGDWQGLKNALLLAKAVSFRKQSYDVQSLYKQLSAATNMGLDRCRYTGEALSETFATGNELTESCQFSTYLYGCLFPDYPYDYTFRAAAQAMVDDFESIFPSYGCLKGLFHTAETVCGKDISPEGFSNRVLDKLSDQDQTIAYSQALKKQAETLLLEPKIKAHITGIPDFIKACFGKGSDLNVCLQAVVDNDLSQRDTVLLVMQEYSVSVEPIQISDALVADTVEREWKRATRGKKTSGLSLGYQARKQVDDAFYQRLELIRDWLEYNNPEESRSIPELRKLKNMLLRDIRQCDQELRQTPKNDYQVVVLWMLDRIRLKLENHRQPEMLYSDLLRTGVISLDDVGLPVLSSAMTEIKYAEPWRTVLRHLAAPEVDLEAATRNIFDEHSLTFDNLHQLEMIGRYLGDDSETYEIAPSQLTEARDSAVYVTEQFKDSLELAYTYNRIYEAEKETLLALIENYQDEFFEQQDLGCWRQFLACLKRQVDESAEQHKRILRLRLDKCVEMLASGEASPLLDEAKQLLLENENFAVAEEYLNRFESGERTLSDELTASLYEQDSFSEFLSDSIFIPLYEECIRKSGQSLSKFGTTYLAVKAPDDWSTRHREDSRKMLTAWPSGGRTTPRQIADLMTCIGLKVQGVKQMTGKKQEIYQLDVVRVARNMPDYRHPIAALGTQIKSPMNVVVLYGKNMAQELVDTITSLNLGGMSIVLIDYPLDRSVRRQIAEIFHTKTSGSNPFLIVDQVLAMHLAMHQDTERMPIMLKCTLPYTYYQPFIRDGGSTADEMFFGRTKELATITDPNGACVVYGGRQLGKTALLERAESLVHKPEEKTYAVYSNILKVKSEAEVVERISSDISRKTSLTLTPCQTLRELCNQIGALIRKSAVSRMLLLLDESDDFLASISADSYMPLQALLDLKRETKNQFKFVLAGLHNVCRAKNATAQNGIFGQLGEPVCVKPLSPTDALQLISRPLRYIGFQVDQYPHLETILTNTNYYPGILQFFGYTLVQTMTSQYGRYYRAVDGNPPYTLKEYQLGAILNSADLNNSIKAKFRLSLELDPRYFMLARCIALLYYEDHSDPVAIQTGFSVDEIIKMAESLEIRILQSESSSSVTNLLDEMVDMGILSRPDEHWKHYRLRRRSFINIIGPNMDAVLDDIIRHNEETA
jgi:hypothetical protein